MKIYLLLVSTSVEFRLISLKIPLPPLEIQNKIANKIKNMRDEAKQLQKEAKEELQNAKEEVERIILSKS